MKRLEADVPHDIIENRERDNVSSRPMPLADTPVAARYQLSKCPAISIRKTNSVTDKSCPSPDYARAREMPSLCILEMSVVRFSPSLAAAPLRPPMIQLVDRKSTR